MFFINKNEHLSYLTHSILLKNTIKVNIFNTVINIQPYNPYFTTIFNKKSLIVLRYTGG